MFVDLEKVKKGFDRYVQSFDLSAPMIRLKYQHSYDVMKIGTTLMDALAWPEDRAQVGIAACLLHDTGRFSQYRDFGTYYDGASTDHGERGYQELRAAFSAFSNFSKEGHFKEGDFKEEHLGDGLDQEAQMAILEAVRWHNKKALPDTGEITPQVMPFCQLARDADKLDIFALVSRRIDEGTVLELLPRHKIDAPLSAALLDEVEAQWSGSYKNASSLLDFLLIQLTWSLDVNFAPSWEMLQSSGVLTRIRDRFPKNDARVQTLLDRLFVRMEERQKTVAAMATAYF
ncbi:MAG: HD domain-containing protein [Synergistaceae bacterium]|nr:HD domain-containing protein [Synergistaceae bacterium]